MCKVHEHPLLSQVDSDLIEKYGDALVIESKYHRYLGSQAYKVLTKIPPINDFTINKVEEMVICNLDRKNATFVKVPKHFTKMSKACGSQIIQNFFIPVTSLGETMELFVDVQRRLNRSGMAAYVINYYEVPPELQKGRAIIMKIGTPKRYPKEIKRIPLPNGNAITFVDL